MSNLRITTFSETAYEPPINTVALAQDGNPFSLCIEGAQDANPKDIDLTIYRTGLHPVTMSLYEVEQLLALLPQATTLWKQHGSKS